MSNMTWIDDLTFRTPSGKVYRLVDAKSLTHEQACEKCVFFSGDHFSEDCKIEHDPEMTDISCWGGDETEGMIFYYIVRIE